MPSWPPVSRSSPSRRASGALLALLALAAGAARADARLDVSGRAVPKGSEIEVTLVVRNLGDAPSGPVELEAELLGTYQEARLDTGVGPGGQAETPLRFPLRVTRPGVHAVAIQVRHTPPVPPQAAPVNVRAFLLLAIGGVSPEPAVRLSVSEARFETRGRVPVELESADGQPHRVRLRALVPRGLNELGPPVVVEVPAAGRATAGLDLLRGTASRPARLGIVVLAAPEDGPYERTTAAMSAVELLPDPARLPKLRVPLILLASALLAAGVGLELWRRW
jgi:hypothetical protein